MDKDNTNNVILKPELIYEFIKDIRDPEKDCSIEDLGIIDEDWISIFNFNNNGDNLSTSTSTPALNVNHSIIEITWKPTSPNCSFAVNIGLCMRYKLDQEIKNFEESLSKRYNSGSGKKYKIPYKLDIIVKEGTHVQEKEINKQVNDKERYLAALECPDILNYVNTLIN